jgi:hypothetical protein
VIERLLENWLNRANERSFQYPFCYLLASQGYRVVHLSRHCGMEIGKDVLAIDPQGVPCAYQLKGVGGGKLSQRRWRSEVQAQVQPLLNTVIVHPSIDPKLPHRSFLVINGELEEEVFYEIKNLNDCQERDGYSNRKLEVILKGDLLDGFKKLQTDFWVENLVETKTYLEMLLENGKGQLPKDKLSRLIQAALPFDREGDKAPSKNEVARSLSGCAIICASAISSFTNEQNHVAEFEAWTIYFGYALGLAGRWDLPEKDIQFALDIATDGMYSALERLCDELMQREHLVEGDALMDRFVYRVRVTRLLGLMGIYALWRKSRIRSGEQDGGESRDVFLREFARKHRRLVQLWGEGAVPEFLAFYFYYRTIDPTQDRVHLLGSVIQGILQLNGRGQGKLANPYYEAEAILPYNLGIEVKPLHDSFAGSSFTLEGVTHLFVRLNYKQTMKQFFSELTRMQYYTLEYDEPWHFHLYRIKAETGHHKTVMLNPPHSWKRLAEIAAECKGESLPSRMRDFVFQYLCVINTFPHRFNSDGIRWLDTRLGEMGLG